MGFSDFTFWNWVAFGALAIAAFGVAIEGVIRRFPQVGQAVHRTKIGAILSFGPLVLVSIAAIVLVFRSGAISPQDSDGKAIELEHVRLQQRVTELEAALRNKEQQVTGFLGGETWQTLSRLLTKLGLKIEDVDPKSYAGLTFEKRIRPDRESVYLYSRASGPETIVFLEGRIDADDKCWGDAGGNARNQMVARIQGQIDSTLTDVSYDFDRGDAWLLLKRQIAITEQTTLDTLSVAIEQITRADRLTRNVARSMCQGAS